MINKHLPITVFSIALCINTILHAEVYKWVDENGKTHYGDKPFNKDAETIELDKGPKLDPDHHSRADKQRRLLDVLDEERQDTKQQKAQAAADKKKREANCAIARKNLSKIRDATFLYKKSNDPRNPTVYSDAERGEITNKAKKAVEQWCK